MTNKNKLNKYPLLGVLIVLVSTLAQAKGGEAGSGGGESGDSISQITHDGGFYSSCSSAVSVLRRSLRMAQFQNGNFSAIRRILVSGLASALKEIPTSENPLTKSALQRGLVLDSQFVNGCRNVSGQVQKAQCLDLELRTSVFFLDKFYNYILTSVYPLDENYWIPYHRDYYPRCHGRYSRECMPSDFYNNFYVAYKDSARDLLNFYIGNNQSGMPDALAMDVYELHVAENIFTWSAQDLNGDIFRREFACAIDDLQSASQDLAAFNAGSTMIFRNSRQAVMFSRSTAESNLETLTGPVCGYRN